MESRRHNPKTHARLSRSAELPVDYTKGVRDVFTTNFGEGLKTLAKRQKAKAAFEVRGAIFSDEIVLAISLALEGQIAATTVPVWSRAGAATARSRPAAGTPGAPAAPLRRGVASRRRSRRSTC